MSVQASVNRDEFGKATVLPRNKLTKTAVNRGLTAGSPRFNRVSTAV